MFELGVTSKISEFYLAMAEVASSIFFLLKI